MKLIFTERFKGLRTLCKSQNIEINFLEVLLKSLIMKHKSKFPSPGGGKKGGMLLVVLLTGCLMSSLAQQVNVMVMKNGAVVFQSNVLDIDSVVFYNPLAPVNTPTTDALVINKNDNSSAEKTLLDNIQKLTFQGIGFSIIPGSGSAKSYPLLTSALSFEESMTLGISTAAAGFDVNAYLTPQGEIVVLTDVLIHSLTLLSMEGKTLGKSDSSTLSISHLPAGVYLLRVETAQGTVVKKVINHSNIR